ncbi:thioredoxin-like protein [Baffinella frigidus]|nr:thioredoxin-like protein [Cryptophyta sp. CCMP2293]
MPASLWEIKVPDINGETFDFETRKGKVMLICNVARNCGMAVPEYSGILALSEKYAEKDFEIILFPCNQFLSLEPGTEAEIAESIKTKFGIVSGQGGFMIMAKSNVNGKDTSPTYTFLKNQKGCDGHIAWNYKGKFLVKKDGSIVALRDTPAKECARAIDEALAA